MSGNVIVFGWKRPLAGRESMSAQHFQEFVQYLGAEKQKGTIESFDVVLLEPTGGALNGFFAIKGEPAKLSALTGSPDWVQHITRAILHLDSPAVWSGVGGAMVQERMELWMKAIPR
jgi:hypothetical protein